MDTLDKIIKTMTEEIKRQEDEGEDSTKLRKKLEKLNRNLPLIRQAIKRAGENQ